MTLSAIYLFNWFYSFSLNKLSLICFCNWKKKKTCLENTGQPDPRLIWPVNPIDTTQIWPGPPVLPRLLKRHTSVALLLKRGTPHTKVKRDTKKKKKSGKSIKLQLTAPLNCACI